MYIRFVVTEIDDRTANPKGVFTTAYELSRSETAQEYEINESRALLVWFEKNLKTPTKFTRRKSKGQDVQTKGLSWIKSSANEMVSKLYELKAIIERHGYIVEVIKSKRPGYIVFEDDHQVVAEPFNREK